LILLRQWGWLVKRDNILYRQILRPEDGESILKLLIPSALIPEVLKKVHQEHCH